jgi:transposase InsO family protein
MHPWNAKPTKKGDGFAQPLEPHDHWQVDFSYLNTAGTFYSPCSVLDGCSRAILAWDIRAAIKEADAEIVLQRAHEDYPGAHPRIITDNGAQFVAKDFKAFIRHFQTSHVGTSPHYPRSNGKIERFHRTLEAQTIRPHNPVDARGGQTRHRHLHRPIQPSSPAQRPRLNRSDRSPRQPPPHHLPATRSKNGSRAPSP